MLKLERFEKARANAVSVMNIISKGMEEKIKICKEMERENLGERIERITKELELLEREYQGIHENLEKIRKEKLQMERIISEYEKRENERNGLMRECEGVKMRIKEVERFIVEVEKKTDKANIESVRKEMENIEREIRDITMKLESEKENERNVREEIASNNTKIKILKDEIGRLENIEGRCPVCDSSIGPERKRTLIEKRILKEKNVCK